MENNNDSEEGSLVAEWYRGSTILLTGGTGFMGKALTEKLLRACPQIRKLFLIVRCKKGIDPQARVKQLFAEPVFDRLKKDMPDFVSKVIAINGDVSQPGLGLSPEDRTKLTQEVTVVLHGAATVRFDEQLRTAVGINISGTKEIILLCRECLKLKAMVHISTAYANCIRKDIQETFYSSPMSAADIVHLTQIFKDDILDAICPQLIQPWPNTYAFTKCIAEDVIREYSKGLPVVIFRPAIVIGANEDPIPGWIDNFYGPTGAVVAVGAGLLRTLQVDGDSNADLVPVDLANNAIIVAAYDIATTGAREDIPIYNFVSSTQNPLPWHKYTEINMRLGEEIPTSKAIWYYTLTMTKHRSLYVFYCLLMHIIPAIFIDAAMMVTFHKPRMLKVYTKIHKFCDVISYFCTREWNFCNSNVQKLWAKTQPADRKLFNFDIASVNWETFFMTNLSSIRQLLLHDNVETIPAAKVKRFRFYLLHRLLQTILLVTALYCFYTLATHLLTVVVGDTYSATLQQIRGSSQAV